MPIRVAVIKDHPLVFRAVVWESDGLSARRCAATLPASNCKPGVNPRVAVINKARGMGLLRKES